MSKTYVNVDWTAVVFTSTQSIARSHHSTQHNMEFIIVQPRLLAGSKFNLSLAPNRRMSFSQLLLESTSTSVPPSLARIRSDPRNLAVVPCACLMMPVTPPLFIYCSKSYALCLFVILSSSLNVLTAIVCKHSENILLSLQQEEFQHPPRCGKKEVQSYPSRGPLLS